MKRIIPEKHRYPLFLVAMVLIAHLLLISVCIKKGDPGPAGAAGANGAQGPAGPVGPKGPGALRSGI